MKQYLDLCKTILHNGVQKGDRTGTGTISSFGHQLRFNLADGFPLATTKKLHVKSILHELLWFLSGSTNIRYLQENGVTIWNEWADENGDLGPIYGKQWVAWERPPLFIPVAHEFGPITHEIYDEPINQIAQVVEGIKKNPDSRRHLVSAWNPADVEGMALPPCHYAFQFYVANGKLSCMFQMRSIDLFLGLPFNIASYAFLTHMVAQQCDLEVGELIWTGGDTHIYLNHVDQIKLQLTREPYPLPQLLINRKPNSIFDYRYEDFEIVGYQSHPGIKGEIAI